MSNIWTTLIFKYFIRLISRFLIESILQCHDKVVSFQHEAMLYKQKDITFSSTFSVGISTGWMHRYCKEKFTSFLAFLLPNMSILLAVFSVSSRACSMLRRHSAIQWAMTSCRNQSQQAQSHLVAPGVSGRTDPEEDACAPQRVCVLPFRDTHEQMKAGLTCVM